LYLFFYRAVKKYFKVELSAVSEKEAGVFLDTLLQEHFIAGGHIFSGETKHWWKGNVDKGQYYYVSGYTTQKHKDSIIKMIEELSEEDVPGVVFFEIADANKNFLTWIEENTRV